MTAGEPVRTRAGWYADPVDPDFERLYDGVEWTSSTRRPRRFAAPHRMLGTGAAVALGMGLVLLIGVSGVVAAIGAADTAGKVVTAVAGLLIVIVIAGGLGALVVFLLRGHGENPAVVARHAQDHRARVQAFEDAVDRLGEAGTGGAAVVMVRDVDQAAEVAFGAAGPQHTAEALERIGFDRMQLASPRLGLIATIDPHGWLEVYRDYVVLGRHGHDVDAHTALSVYLDGAVQIVPRQLTHRGKLVTVNEQHDLRQAEVQVVGGDWSVRARIRPDDVNEARRVGEQLRRITSALGPQAATADDVERMVDRILGATGQPPAEKLRELSNLRFERLLSDDEFEQAKAKILSLDAGLGLG